MAYQIQQRKRRGKFDNKEEIRSKKLTKYGEYINESKKRDPSYKRINSGGGTDVTTEVCIKHTKKGNTLTI